MEGDLYGVTVLWLVDTGCNTTILSEASYFQIPAHRRPMLKPYESCLRMADGAPLTVLGQANFAMVIGGKRVTQNMIVAQCRVNGLLGMDFMCAQDMVINLATETVECRGKEVPSMIQYRTHCKCARVTVAETVTIPAGSRMIVQGKMPMRVPEGDWLVEPLSRPVGGHSLLVAKTLAAGGKSRVPMEVMNPTPSDVILYKDTNAALLQPVMLHPELEPIPPTWGVSVLARTKYTI